MAAEKKSRAGRRSKMNDQTIMKVCGWIKRGNTVRASCLIAGIHQDTFYHWKATGEKDRKDGQTTKFSRFLDEVDHAEAVSQNRLINQVLSMGGYKGALEILKRRFPAEFGDKTALMNPDGTALPATGGPPISVTIRCDGPAGDNPFIIHPSALPPAPESPPDTAEAGDPPA